jgi:hypothetical protein
MVLGRRPLDSVRVEIVGSGVLDNFTSLSITNDITMPCEAAFEVGDDGTWNSIQPSFKLGTQLQVFVNDRPRLRGRIEVNDAPLDTQAGSVLRFTVRIKLSDAMYASAGRTVQVKDTSIKDFLLALYRPLGYAESDFIFKQSLARDLVTGKAPTRNGASTVLLEPIKIEEARVQPGESIYAAADRHLRRHGFMHWDSADGRIVVGVPDDTQDPTYVFNAYRYGGNTSVNNILGASRTMDWSGIPSDIAVFGKGGKRGFGKNNVTAAAADADVLSAGFYRPVDIVAEGIRTIDLAVRAANRELSARSKRKDGFSIELDGLSWWDGHNQIAFGPDTVALVNTDVAGGNAGAYYVHAVTLSRSAASGDTAQLDLVKRGIWKL